MRFTTGRRQAQQRKTQSIDIRQTDDTQQLIVGSEFETLASLLTTHQYSKCIPTDALVKVQKLLRFEQSAYQQYVLGSPRIDLLLTLTKFNVFRALLDNTKTLGFTLEWVEGDDAISPFYQTGYSNNSNSLGTFSDCPSHLQPTPLQKVINHHPWIDLFPVPRLRDNILARGDLFDDGLLCFDIVELCGGQNEQSGLFVWGDPWNLRSWEVGEGFFRNWSWVVEGCWELCASTNYWRAKRGQGKLFPDTMCGISTVDLNT